MLSHIRLIYVIRMCLNNVLFTSDILIRMFNITNFNLITALLLGTGLVVFASALSETMLEATQYNNKESLQGPNYDYRYGWCFITAGAAFIMTKIAAVFSLTGYLNRFPSVDEMV